MTKKIIGMRKVVKFFTSLFAAFIYAFLLTGCQSTDKTSYLGSGDNFKYTCSYDTNKNETYIKLESYIQNNTIYKIEKVTIVVDLYLDESLVKKEGIVARNFDVNHGETKYFTFNTIYGGGEVNRIEYVSWTATYKTLWDSYAPWFITSIIVASIILAIFILVMIINDLELDVIVDFFEKHYRWFFPPSFSIFIGWVSYLVNGIVTGSWSWVPPVILIGIVASVVILGLIALGIKYLFTDVFGFGGFQKINRHRKRSYKSTVVDEDGNEYTIDDLKDDKKSLMAFSKENLVEWCREKGLTGYSKLSKSQLVEFIVNGNADNKTETKESPKVKKKNVK